MRIVIALILTGLLAACVTTAERAAQMQRDVDEMIQVYGPACERLGYKGDSDPWRDCVLRLSSKDSFERYGRYGRYPVTTSCFGHRGFFNCTTF
jgi:hypothetical protein